MRAILVAAALSAGTASAQVQPPVSVDPPPFNEPLSAPPASVPKEDEVGFTIGAHVGYGLPFGRAADAPLSDLSSVVSGEVPFGVSLGYRFSPYVGASFSFDYAYGIIASGTDTACMLAGGGGCSASDMRYGVNLEAHILPRLVVDPWVGLGLGYESLQFNAPAGWATSYEGMEFFEASTGLDVRASHRVRIGPFFTFTVGEYQRKTSRVLGFESAQGIANTAIHDWAIAGIRVQFTI